MKKIEPKKTPANVAGVPDFPRSEDTQILTQKGRGEALQSAVSVGPFVVNSQGEKTFESKGTGAQFFIGTEGVFVEKAGKSRAAVCTLIEVVARGSSPDGAGYCQLVRFKDDIGRVHEIILTASELASRPSALVSRLMSEGLRVYRVSNQGGNADLVDYLNNCPTSNRFTTVERFGWIDVGKVFALPGEVISKGCSVDYRYTGDSEAAPKYSASGTLSQWRDTIGLNALHSTRVMFALCVGLAAPLMAFINEQSGGFHFVGPTSKGKSTSLRAACSLWAGVSSGEVKLWRSTDNGLEPSAEARTDLLLILDEMNQADKRVVEQSMYMLGNGVGKQRMSRNASARKTKTWRTIFMSAGEVTPEQYVGHEIMTGASVRMANVNAIVSQSLGVFESVPEGMDSQQFSEQFTKDGSRYYGTAGPEFIRHLIDEVEIVGGAVAMGDRLNRRLSEWIKENAVGHDSEVRRVARRFALAAEAGEMAIRYGVLPWADGAASAAAESCFRSFLNEFIPTAVRRRLLAEKPLEFIFENPESFRYWSVGSEDLKDGMRLNPCFGYVVCDMPEKPGAMGAPIVAFFTAAAVKKMVPTHDRGAMVEALREQNRLASNEGDLFKPSGKKLYGVIPSGVRFFTVLFPDVLTEKLRNDLANGRRDCLSVLIAQSRK